MDGDIRDRSNSPRRSSLQQDESAMLLIVRDSFCARLQAAEIDMGTDNSQKILRAM
jgi:hypothetical protein